MSPRRFDNPSPDDLRREAREIQESGRTEGGKSPSRVAAGKKAAATRKEKAARHSESQPQQREGGPPAG
jgi:hypothetical protein